MSSDEQKRRGRPRGYAVDAAVAAAQRLFWRIGLEDASFQAITAATGLHRPSLVAGFGGKEGLYLAALDAYQARAGTLIAAALARPALSDALAAFFASDLDLFCGEGPGCFLIGTALAAADPAIRARGMAALEELKTALAARVEAAPALERAGEDPARLVALLFALHLAIAVQARAGVPRPALEQQVAHVLAPLSTPPR